MAMGSAQWGSGYHAGKSEGKRDGRIEGSIGGTISAFVIIATANYAVPRIKDQIEKMKAKKIAAEPPIIEESDDTHED